MFELCIEQFIFASVGPNACQVVDGRMAWASAGRPRAHSSPAMGSIRVMVSAYLVNLPPRVYNLEDSRANAMSVQQSLLHVP